MNTEAINHDPAVTFIQTGFQLAGRPSLGAWLSYGLGSENEDLPAFVVMISQVAADGQPLYDRLWGSGFLPSQYQGVKFRSAATRCCTCRIPKGFTADSRRAVARRARRAEPHDSWRSSAIPEIDTRIAQYEMAFRMQTSVPELTDLSKEPAHTFELYGAGRAQARHLRRQLPAGAAAGRARRALHPALPSRLGSARQPAGGPAEALQGCRTRPRRRWSRT